jgi:cytidylate kinase
MSAVPVITIDGLSGSGKGTISVKLAKALQWHFLDSGALYRLIALAAQKLRVDVNDVEVLTSLIPKLAIEFIPIPDTPISRIMLNHEDVSIAIRHESIAKMASLVAQHQPVRVALTDKQRAFREKPGLVADGRDMGTIIFPDAIFKFFLTATAEERAQRRYLQLKEQGIPASLDSLLTEIKARDARDQSRQVAPAIPAVDAMQIDTTHLTINEVYQVVWSEVKGLLNT